MLLMVIYYLDVSSAGRVPAEADSVLVVDSNAVLASAIAVQRFKPVTRRQPQRV